MKLPAKLELLPNLKWTGKMKVIPILHSRDTYLVKFDARDSRGGAVYDQYEMTAELIEKWTGVDVRRDTDGW